MGEGSGCLFGRQTLNLPGGRRGVRDMDQRGVPYGDFFRNTPELNENRRLIKGVVCGVRVEDIEEPLMREIRYLDKLIDELARGKAMDKILRKQ